MLRAVGYPASLRYAGTLRAPVGEAHTSFSEKKVGVGQGAALKTSPRGKSDGSKTGERFSIVGSRGDSPWSMHFV